MRNSKLAGIAVTASLIASVLSPMTALADSTGSTKSDFDYGSRYSDQYDSDWDMEGKDGKNETEYEGYSEEGVQSASIYASLSGGFEVAIPKTLIIDAKTKSADYYVRVTGEIADGESVYVSPDAQFTLTDQVGNEITGLVEQDKEEFDSIDIQSGGSGAEAVGTLSVPDLKVGTWEGTLDFNISLGNSSN